jgi:GNAT superfamily N-acetyltransferase
MQVVELDPDDPVLAEVLPVLRELRPHLDLELFRSVYAEGWPQGLRFSALFVPDESDPESDVCVGVAGWRIMATTSAVRKLYVDDLVTTADRRSSGHGRFLLEYLRHAAASYGCGELDLDSGVQRFDAHRFYFREGMHISSHHFRTSVAAEPPEPLRTDLLDPAPGSRSGLGTGS